MGFLRQYLIAVQFFTRMPLNETLAQWAGFHPDMQRASAAHWPGVGWLAGLLACTVFALLGLALPGGAFAPLVAAVGCTAATVLLTGAAHENGLAGLSARLAGPGQMPALALLLVVAAKLSLLAVLAEQSPVAVLLALWAGHVLSRFWPLLLGRTLPYLGGAPGTGNRPLTERIDTRVLAIAAAWCVVPLAVALLANGLAFVLISALSSGLALWGLRYLLLRRMRGYDSDSLGAAQQLCEIAFYLGAAIGLGVG